jgi:hypothetical protein
LLLPGAPASRTFCAPVTSTGKTGVFALVSVLCASLPRAAAPRSFLQSPHSNRAKQEFQHYARQGQLVVSAVASWNDALNFAEVKRVGERPLMREFAEFFQAEGDGKKVAELKALDGKLREFRFFGRAIVAPVFGLRDSLQQRGTGPQGQF